MATYTSKYAELSFYVNGSERKFSAGKYEAGTQEEIAVLDRLVDAVRVDEPEPAAKKAEEAPKPAPKPRKAAADTSAK